MDKLCQRPAGGRTNSKKERTMSEKSRVEKMVDVIRELHDAELHPRKLDRWFVPFLHDRRNALAQEMTAKEKDEARKILGALGKHV